MSIYKDQTQDIELRINDLMNKMTLTEKIGQLCQHPMLDYKVDKQKYFQEIIEGKIGSRILADTAWAGNAPGEKVEPKEINEIQKMAVENSRLGIPILFARDVIYGQSTVLPIPLAQAASWNPALVNDAYKLIAKEATSLGIKWTFAPMLDVARDPRWGRVIETFGEDPYLIGQFAQSVIHGFQGEELSNSESMLACAKHFVGYAAVEGGRDYDTTELSLNTLYNVHLPPFLAAISSGVSSIMTSFTDLAGTPLTSSNSLVKKWLKEKNNFEGIVISDWGSIADLTHFGVAKDAKDAAKKAINAGIDVSMPQEPYDKYLEQLVLSGDVDIKLINAAVYRVLKSKFKLNLFENPYVDENKHHAVLRAPAHIKVALELAEQSIVLLKNINKILPVIINEELVISVVGPHAHTHRQHLGSWCLDGQAEDVTSIYEGISNLVNDKCKILTEYTALTDEMIECANRSDIIFLCIGESHRRTGEARNIAELCLPPGQEELIEAMGRTGKKLIVIQCTGRPIPSLAIENHADALLYAWQLGTEAGTAIANILFGKTDPSGKLPITIPRCTGQIPIYYGRKPLGKMRDYQEYCYYKDTLNSPLYPFGFGLTYSDFKYGSISVNTNKILKDSKVIASINITNESQRDGVEIVQCYIRQHTASSTRPVLELKQFKRVKIKKRSTLTVKFDLTHEDFKFYDQSCNLVTEPSVITIYIGSNSTDLVAQELKLY